MPDTCRCEESYTYTPHHIVSLSKVCPLPAGCPTPMLPAEPNTSIPSHIPAAMTCDNFPCQLQAAVQIRLLQSVNTPLTAP